ncbi:hypothetical protein DFH27DRAFT_567215 [Peziza echinospora]|nr:hypothetical protein DFH27DRAFT_567215 [Peziza echinospora]
MKPASRLRLSAIARPGATISTCSLTASTHFQAPLLPFLYPPHIRARNYTTPTTSSSSSGPPNSDPWAFLLGTAESDTLPPPPFLQHFGQPRERPQKDFSQGYYPMLSHYQERIREKFSTNNIAGGANSSSSHQPAGTRSGLDPTYSTITERERQIFASIFESILSESPLPGGTIGSPMSSLPGGGGGGKDRLTRAPTPTLTALFESAVGPQFNRHELSFGPADPRKSSSITAAMARASAIAEYPASLRVAAAHAAGLPKVPLTKAEEREESARQERLVSTIHAMQSCKTDLELIEYMDKHVFTMVSSDAPSSDSIAIKGRKYTFPSASYADLLAEGIKLLRKTFRDLSGALSIFERIKALGATSYVVGCSVAVYNHVLEAQWEAYRDISRIEGVLEEMRINGIEGDSNTVEILRILTRDAIRLGKSDGLPSQLSEKELETLFRVEQVAEGMWNAIRNREESAWNVPGRGSGGIQPLSL